MTGPLLEIITSPDPAVRDQSLDARCRPLSAAELLAECAELDAFRRRSDNLYQRVRALFFLYALHRFHLPAKLGRADLRRTTATTDPLEIQLLTAGTANKALVPFKGYEHLLQRRFEEA